MKETIIVTGPLAEVFNQIRGYDYHDYLRIKKETDEMSREALHICLKWSWVPGIIFLSNLLIWFDKLFIAPVALVNISNHISLVWKILASLGIFYLLIFILCIIAFINCQKE